MQHFTADALILRSVVRGEHDRLITVLTADFGNIGLVEFNNGQFFGPGAGAGHHQAQNQSKKLLHKGLPPFIDCQVHSHLSYCNIEIVKRKHLSMKHF